MMSGKIFSVGHSNRTIDDFIDLLKEHDIYLVVDLRTHPFSRWNPHFNREKLRSALEDEQVEYLYFGDRLGGRPEGGLEAFLASEAFKVNVTALLDTVRGKNVALMCAERDQEKCHRQYIVAEVERRGIEVTPIGQASPGAATLDDFSTR